MGRGLIRTVVITALVVLCAPALAFAQATPEDAIVITSPKEGDSMVNTAAEISGTSPPSTIVTVTITDTDTNRVGIAHQENGKVEGTVTASREGNWTYVPQHLLVPGQFSAKASYVNNQNQVISSKTVSFVSLNENGSSVQISSSLVKRLIVWGGLAVLFLAGIVIFFVNRRHKKDTRTINANAESIEKELARTMAELTRTNAELAELNKKIDRQGERPLPDKSDEPPASTGPT